MSSVKANLIVNLLKECWKDVRAVNKGNVAVNLTILAQCISIHLLDIEVKVELFDFPVVCFVIFSEKLREWHNYAIIEDKSLRIKVNDHEVCIKRHEGKKRGKLGLR